MGVDGDYRTIKSERNFGMYKEVGIYEDVRM